MSLRAAFLGPIAVFFAMYGCSLEDREAPAPNPNPGGGKAAAGGLGTSSSGGGGQGGGAGAGAEGGGGSSDGGGGSSGDASALYEFCGCLNAAKMANCEACLWDSVFNGCDPEPCDDSGLCTNIRNGMITQVCPTWDQQCLDTLVNFNEGGIVIMAEYLSCACNNCAASECSAAVCE
jgi:hypothetical protein